MALQPPQPAAAGGGAVNPPHQPLPVPAQTPALFATLFADADRDPTKGNPGTLLGPFHHDLNNAGANTPTGDLRNMLAISGAQQLLMAVTIISGGRARAYICPFRWEDGLTNNNPALTNKNFALEGELIGSQGHTVEFDRGVFDLLQQQVAVPTVTTIQAAYAADVNATQLGPYTTADAGTEIVKTRRIVPIPHFLVEPWLAEADGIDGPRFWRVYHPLIVAAGEEAACAALIQFFQI